MVCTAKMVIGAMMLSGHVDDRHRSLSSGEILLEVV